MIVTLLPTGPLIGLTSVTVGGTEANSGSYMPLPDGEPALANDVKLVAELYLVREA